MTRSEKSVQTRFIQKVVSFEKNNNFLKIVSVRKITAFSKRVTTFNKIFPKNLSIKSFDEAEQATTARGGTIFLAL